MINQNNGQEMNIKIIKTMCQKHLVLIVVAQAITDKKWKMKKHIPWQAKPQILPHNTA